MQSTITPFNVLCDRVMRQVNAARGDKEKHVHIERLGAVESDWSRLMSEISENDNVRVAHRDDGSVDLFWTVPKEYP